MAIGVRAGDAVAQKLVRRYYFFSASLLLLALTLIGFSDNLFTNVGQPSNSDPKFIVHGLLCGAWTIMLAAQSWLVGSGNVGLHRKLGLAGFAIAVGVTLSTLWVFVVVWKGWAAMSPEVKANRLLLPSFTLFAALAYLNRRRPEWHKRLVFTGTLFMLEPVLARCFDPLFVPFLVGFTEPQIEATFLPWLFSVWLGLFASLAAYDMVVARRIHPVTTAALLWFAGVWALATNV